MADSRYDPTPETLDRIRDRDAAEAAAQRVAGNEELRLAVDKMRQADRQAEEAKSSKPAPASTGQTYLPEVKPKPVPGKLTVPRIEVRSEDALPRRGDRAPRGMRPRELFVRGHTTVRAFSLQPLVKLGLADVVNDGHGDIRPSYRWKKIALFAAPFVLLAGYGVWRAAVGPDAPTPAPAPTTAQPAPPPLPEHVVAPPPEPPAPAPTEEPAAPATAIATSPATPATAAPEPPAAPPPERTATARPTAVEQPAEPKPKATTQPSASPGGWKPEF